MNITGGLLGTSFMRIQITNWTAASKLHLSTLLHLHLLNKRKRKSERKNTNENNSAMSILASTLGLFYFPSSSFDLDVIKATIITEPNFFTEDQNCTPLTSRRSS